MGKKRGKSSAHTSKPEKDELSGALAAAITAMVVPVMMKVCRLCEAKDGPFLNIFDMEKNIANKIDTLLPFTITEYDDLPHKICFRCSAKIEELNEFVTKCIKTQENLRAALGKEGTFITKTKTTKLWEEKLNKSNMSNDDICDAIVKQAMKGIADLPLAANVEADNNESTNTLKTKTVSKRASNSKPTASPKIAKTISDTKLNMNSDSNLDEDSAKLELVPRKTRRSAVNSDEQADALEIKPFTRKKQVVETPVVKEPVPETHKDQVEVAKVKKESNRKSKGKNKSVADNIAAEVKPDETNNVAANTSQNQNIAEVQESKKAFDIFEHISTIKVNGVGVLYQCHLCNRNFLCKDIVSTHGCAKTGVPKQDFATAVLKNEPPKIAPSTVKYITNKPKTDPDPPVEDIPKELIKPRIGPASRVKKSATGGMPTVGMKVVPKESNPPLQMTSTDISPHATIDLPALKNKFRLVPGPDNTFTLVEDFTANEPGATKRASAEELHEEAPKPKKLVGPKSFKMQQPIPTEIIDIDDDDDIEETDDKNQSTGPYPVGLFQTPQTPQAPVTFTAPAIKKQSYTVVQTGNPSKFLISTKVKPSNDNAKPKSKKKSKKDNDEPYKVTLEDDTRPNDMSYLSVYNVDPLLQPSYVLPSNTIQESQISTSTPIASGSSNKDDIYTCSMCPEKFSREKKLLTHIQSHFSSIDSKDRRRRKS